ncbi:MAG: DUF4384 domain-containing protein [Desulfobacterales bacterium]|nr:DUF4384 domain-containing protein [Desulfobacterales bacterium]
MIRNFLLILASLFFLISGCVSVQKGAPTSFFPAIDKDASVAVSYISEASSGDITALGNLWRERIEKSLTDNGIRVKARKDITIIIDDLESFGPGLNNNIESDLWEKAGADVIVTGSYTILNKKYTNPSIRVIVKALDIKQSRVIGVEEFEEKLDASWVNLESNILGNVYQKQLENVVSPYQTNDLPKLEARLDKKKACYKSGESARIFVKTEPGVFLYIFNLAADQSATLLYPNKWFENKPLTSGAFVFPPDKYLDSMKIVLYPLEENKPCKESFKIVASKQKIDFSFIPVPENQIYIAAKAGSIKRITNELKKNKAFKDVVLSYYVGNGCD